MPLLRRAGVLALLLALLAVNTPVKAASPIVHPEMIYFVMLDRFENGDPANDQGGLSGLATTTGFLPSDTGFYHGGDIRGLINRIPYIKSLGFTAIWVTPVVRQLPVAVDGKSAAYHGYWGVGFDQVDPHLGTMADFKEFVSTAHTAQMKVILDIVVNHTADVIHSLSTGQYVGLVDNPYTTKNGKAFDPKKLAETPNFPGVDQLSAVPCRASLRRPSDRSRYKGSRERDYSPYWPKRLILA
jgi:glycosidase